MRHTDKAELLQAMKGCLRDLEDTRLISPDDLDIIDQKRVLRHEIAHEPVTEGGGLAEIRQAHLASEGGDAMSAG